MRMERKRRTDNAWRLSSWAAMIVATVGFADLAGAAEFAIAFENRTCGEISLSATGNESCFGYGGCKLTIPEGKVERAALREGVRPRWAKIDVTGQCGGEPRTSINGSCGVDLAKVLGPAGYEPKLRGPGTSEPGPTKVAPSPLFEPVDGPLDRSTSFATIAVDLGICDVAGDGSQQCDVSCRAR